MADEKCFTQKFMEGFGLEFPKDADRFVEIFTRFTEDGGMFGQLIDELVDAFPEKKDRILVLPIYSEFDGEG
jgi:hypothetical protein